MSSYSRKRLIYAEATMPESRDDQDRRSNRATSLALAAICYKGDTIDVGKLLGLADDFLEYIEGNDFAPLHDVLLGGKVPRQ